jgi:hypothetical protein
MTAKDHRYLIHSCDTLSGIFTEYSVIRAIAPDRGPRIQLFYLFSPFLTPPRRILLQRVSFITAQEGQHLLTYTVVLFRVCVP